MVKGKSIPPYSYDLSFAPLRINQHSQLRFFGVQVSFYLIQTFSPLINSLTLTMYSSLHPLKNSRQWMSEQINSVRPLCLVLSGTVCPKSSHRSRPTFGKISLGPTLNLSLKPIFLILCFLSNFDVNNVFWIIPNTQLVKSMDKWLGPTTFPRVP